VHREGGSSPLAHRGVPSSTTRILAATLCALAAAIRPAPGAPDARLEVPLVFEHAESALVDSFATGKSSGWIWLPPTGEGEAHLYVGNVPYGFALRTRLVVEYEAASVWPGNIVPCRAWIEPDEDPDQPELYSSFGIEVGVQCRPIVIEWPVLSYGKDFRISYTDDGPAPLGTNFLGGIDQVDTFQIPVATILKGVARPLVKSIAGLLSSLDDAGVNLFSVNLCAEGVVEGTDIQVGIGDHTLRFRQYGVAAATNFTLYVPINRPDPYAPAHPVPILPIYHHNFYQTDGLVFSLISPFELWITPSIVERAGSMLAGNYQPPSAALLTNASFYKKSQSGAATRAKENPEIALPITGQPNLPDLTTVDLVCNPFNDDRHTGGRAYAAETTTVRFTVANIGARATQTNAHLEYSVTVDGATAVPPTLMRSGGRTCVIPAGGSTNLFFHHVFTEGPHQVRLRTAYLEVKTMTNGAPVYGLGDANVNNNMAVTVPVYAHPPRGTVTGRCHPNPDAPGAGIGGLLVWLHGTGGSRWATSSLAAGDARGTFRFERVPAGDYMIEFLVPSNGAPDGLDYVPKAVAFVHPEGGTTELDGQSGMYMLQFQDVMGILETPSHARIAGVRAEYGNPVLCTGTSAANGVVTFPRVPPRGLVSCAFHHDAYESRKIHFDPRVEFTAQTNAWIPSYVDAETDEHVSGCFVQLTPDTRPPALDVQPPARGGACTTNLALSFRTTDGAWKDSREWRWQIQSADGLSVVQDSAWAAYATPSNRADFVANAWNLSALTNGAYRLALMARDAAGLVTTRYVPFVRDTAAPTCTVSVAGGAVSTADGCADVTVTLARPEPMTWSVELSNDGATWSAPAVFSGSSTGVVRRWRLAGDLFAGTVTVTARVTDAAGNVAGASDAIAVDTTGYMQLAGGADFVGTTNIPVDVRIIPPPSSIAHIEPSFGGSVPIGSHATNRHRAQAMALTGTVNLAAVQIRLTAVGSPGPLHLKLVGTLGTDPTGGPAPLAHAVLTADAIPSNSEWIATFPAPVAVSGSPFLLLYEDGGTTQDYYNVSAGYSAYGTGMLRYDFVPGIGWVVAPINPSFGCETLAYRLQDDRRGRIRCAADGTCDTEPWHTYLGPATGLFTASVAGAGSRTVAVQYENSYSNSLAGTYYDSIWVDLAPPTVTGLTVMAVDTAAGIVRVALTALDADAGIARIEWSLDGGLHWSSTNWQPVLDLPFNTSFGDVRVRAVDRSGLTGPVVAAQTPSDSFPPSLGFWINDTAAYTRNPTVTLNFAVSDDRGATSCVVHVQDLVLGNSYGPFNGGTGAVAVTIPASPMQSATGAVDVVVDGLYTFQAGVLDSANHASAAVRRSILLDRNPPTIRSIVLSDAGGRAWVSNAQFVARIGVEDAFGPLSRRIRINGGAWSDWLQAPHGELLLSLDAPPPLPTRHTLDVEVMDGAGNTATGSASIKVNRPPSRPLALAPSGEIGSRTPPLYSDSFSDPDGDAFGLAEFIVRNESKAIIIHSGPLAADTYVVPGGFLVEGSKYEWQLRMMDADGLWSPWSEATTFQIARDSDADGLSDSIEDATGTHPEKPDSDGDGIPDGVEDRSLNGIVDPGESDPRLADTDEDKLPDGAEDLNHNGRRDPGETDPCNPDSDGLPDGREDADGNGIFDPGLGESDPRRPDTDGDGQSDGVEDRAGTDPNDPEGRFTVDGMEFRPTTQRLYLRWRGRAGRTYHLYGWPSLLNTQQTLISTQTPGGGIPPWYLVVDQKFTHDGIVSQQFYRIEMADP